MSFLQLLNQFHFSLKGFELIYEAFPQVIIGAFTMQSLQLWEDLNILSFFISLLSLLYGLGEFLALNAHNLDVDVDFVFTAWGVLAALVDTLLRCLFLSYVLSIAKAYAFLIMFLYVVLMLLTTCCVQKSCAFDIFQFLYTLCSIPSSAFENPMNDQRLRFRSKVIFNSLIVVSMSFVLVSTNTDHLAGIGYSLNSTSLVSNDLVLTDCAYICSNEFDDFCLYRWRYLDQSTHLTIHIVLFFLLGLSILETILETCLDSMPYKQLYKKANSKRDSALNSLKKMEGNIVDVHIKIEESKLAELTQEASELGAQIVSISKEQNLDSEGQLISKANFEVFL